MMLECPDLFAVFLRHHTSEAQPQTQTRTGVFALLREILVFVSAFLRIRVKAVSRKGASMKQARK